MTEVEPPIIEPDHDPRLIAATLACAWAAMGCSVLALGVMVAMSSSTVALAPVMVTLLLVQVPAFIAALVLSVLGGMWRRWLDGSTTAVLLVCAAAANLMLWPYVATQANISFTGFGQCMSAFGSCSSDGGTADLWIGVGVQTLVLALLLTASAHWVWRLRPEPTAQRNNRVGTLGLALIFVAVLAATDANIDTARTLSIADSNGSDSGFSAYPPSGSPHGGKPAGSISLHNDLGYPARVVYCPMQNCHGQPAKLMVANASATFPVHSAGSLPDTFVVLSSGNPPACSIVDFAPGETSGAGSAGMALSMADSTSCGIDLESLTVPR